MSSATSSLEIRNGDQVLSLAEIAIVIPVDSPSSPSKLAGFVAGSEATAKHAFHALSQIALYDFEDEILDIEAIPEGQLLVVKANECDTPIDEGMIIVRDTEGKVHIFAHDNVDHYRLLKFAHRYCTRWVRLDI